MDHCLGSPYNKFIFEKEGRGLQPYDATRR